MKERKEEIRAAESEHIEKQEWKTFIRSKAREKERMENKRDREREGEKERKRGIERYTWDIEREKERR